MTLISKITPPRPQNIVERQRLYKILDKAVNKPLTWLSASAGSGKTTLISGYIQSRRIPCIWYQVDARDSDLATFFYYMGLAVREAEQQQSRAEGRRYRTKNPLPLLTSEYLSGIPTFTKRYFEELFSRLIRLNSFLNRSNIFFIVFDNYQEVSNPQFHEMLLNGIEVMPEGFKVIVISRNQPPSDFARLFANDKINLIQDSEIRFNLEESKKLVSMRSPKADGEFIKAVFEKTRGWPAGIVLMMEMNRLKGETSGNFASEAIFDYFAREIFNKIDKTVRDFLLKTAFLPVINIFSAEKLTGSGNAERILSNLNRYHYFTERLSEGDVYLYHPLFREFLLKMAKSLLSHKEMFDIGKETALLLEKSGEIEASAKMYQSINDMTNLCRLILDNASEFLSRGRSNTLRELITAVPEELLQSNPWLLYWMGMCYFPVDMPASRKYLEKAFELFNSVRDSKGIYISWAGLVDTYAFGLDEWKPLDNWIEAFEKIRREYEFPSKEIELIASSRMLMSLTLRKTDKAEQVQKWLQQVSALLQENPSFEIKMDTIFAMSLYYLWKGEYGKSELLLEKAKQEALYHNPSPFILIKVNLMSGVHSWIRADYKKALTVLSEGLEISGKSGVNLFNSLLWSFKAASEMARGNRQLAQEALQNQIESLLSSESTLEVFFYHINCAWHSLIEGNPSLAAEHMQTISAKTAKMGTPYYTALWHIGMAQTEFALGNIREAKMHIHKALLIGSEMKSYVIEWYSLLVSAYFHFMEGNNKLAIDELKKGMTISRKYGYVHLEFYQPDVMRILFAQAIKNSIEPEYLKGLIKKLRLYPVDIRTLGTFEVIKEGKPLHFEGRVKHKPLELLKAIIAFGGSDVSDIKITEALWPDTDGDRASQSLKFTLHELRKLLGSDRYVLLQEKRLTLNSDFCSVDVWQFDSLLKDAESRPSAQLFKEAMGLYRGDFLADEDYSWSVQLRERLRGKIIRVADNLCLHYEKVGCYKDAIDVCQKILEIDNLQEEFYRRLMSCFIKLGRTADAVLTYRRCKDALMSGLGIEPSQATEEIYRKVCIT